MSREESSSDRYFLKSQHSPFNTVGNKLLSLLTFAAAECLSVISVSIISIVIEAQGMLIVFWIISVIIILTNVQKYIQNTAQARAHSLSEKCPTAWPSCYLSAKGKLNNRSKLCVLCFAHFSGNLHFFPSVSVCAPLSPSHFYAGCC